MSTGTVETGAIASGFRRPRRSARAVGDVRERHGGQRIATGLTIAAGVILLWQLARAVLLAPVFPPGVGPWGAWLAILAILAAGVVSRIFSRAKPLPDPLYVVLLLALAVPVWLDVSATWGLLHLGVTPTAAAATGAVLMPVAAIRGTRVSLAVSSTIGFVLVVATLLQAATAGPYLATGLTVAASAVLPLVLAVVAIRGFRRLVGLELDLSIVQSTVSTPRSAFGMRASEELAQLDFDAETLLDDVGSGRIAIPLPAADAERAGRLAAALRLRLIERRTETWLRHAVTESAYLNDRVVVDDPDGFAGLLAQDQRDSLLLSLWLLVGERRKGQPRPTEVRVSSPDGDDDADHQASMVLIAIEVFGVVRRRVDPATWDAVGSVGSYDVVAGSDSFRIEIECRTDPTVPASASAAEAARPRGI